MYKILFLFLASSVLFWKSSSVKEKKNFFNVKYSWNLFTSGSMTRVTWALVLFLSLTAMDQRTSLWHRARQWSVDVGVSVPPGGTGHHTLPGAGTAWKPGPNFTKMSLVPMWRSVLRHPAGLHIILPNKRGHPVLERWGWSHVAWKQWCVSQENRKEVQQFLCQTLEVINIRTNISLIYISLNSR